MAFTVVKFIGAAYLLWMGVRLLRASTPGWTPEAAPAEPDLRRVFRRGFLTNVLNPKVALFFLAFLPQFIAPDASHKTLAFLALGVLFSVNALPVTLGYAWLAAWAADRVSLVRRAMHWLDRAAGVLFIGFGLKLALTDHPAP